MSHVISQPIIALVDNRIILSWLSNVNQQLQKEIWPSWDIFVKLFCLVSLSHFHLSNNSDSATGREADTREVQQGGQFSYHHIAQFAVDANVLFIATNTTAV